MSANCLPSGLIRLCLLGKLEPELAGPFESHAAECDRCCEVMAWYSANPGCLFDPNLSDVPGLAIGVPVGGGGMGEVYEATDRLFDREVAFKTTLSSDKGSGRHHATLDDQLRWRFEDERRITSQLQYPGVPPVHACGTLKDGRPYFVLKLIRGGRTLHNVLHPEDGRRPAVSAVLPFFLTVAQTVAYAHEHGVIHRDLKPANVMVGKHPGEVYVMDWGLARQVPTGADSPPPPARNGELPRTWISASRSGGEGQQTFGLVGTPQYMAPEQASPEQRSAQGPWTDVFSLGAFLCEILTGRPPYEETRNKEVLRLNVATAQTQAAFRRLERCGADRALVRLAKWCMAADPSSRPASAKEVVESILAYQVQAQVRSRRLRIVAPLAVIVPLVIVLAGFLLFTLQSRATHRWEADAALGRAQAVLQTSGPGTEEFLTEMKLAETLINADGLNELRGRHETLSRAARVHARLDEIDDMRWAGLFEERHGRLAPDRKALAQLYQSAVEDLGVDLEGATPRQAADTVLASPIARRLQEALDAWFAFAPGDRLLGVLGELDPNPARQEVRRAYLAKDAARIRTAVSRLDLQTLTPSFAVFAGYDLYHPPAVEQRIANTAQARHPRHFGVAMWLATRAMREGRSAEAVACARLARALRPNSPVALKLLSLASEESSDLETAVVALREVARLTPEDATNHSYLGLLLERQGDYPAAVSAHEEAVRLQPDDAFHHYSLGRAMFVMGDPRRAAGPYAEAVRIRPDYAFFRYALGQALSDSGRHAQAVDECLEATRLAPDDAEMHFGLGDALRARQSFPQAADAYRRGVALQPARADGFRRLAEALEATGDVEGAEHAFVIGLCARPDDPQLRLHYGLLLWKRLGRPREAIVVLQRAVDGDETGRQAALYPLLAKLLDSQGEPFAGLGVLALGVSRNEQLIDEFLVERACLCCAAAMGGVDTPREVSGVRLRALALEAMTMELEAQRARANDAARWPQVHADVSYWLVSDRLSAVRNADALPPEERPGWSEFWSAARELAARTSGGGPSPPAKRSPGER